MLGSVDWQGIATVIAAAGAALAAVIGALNRRSLRVPSGGSIGAKVEGAHDNGVANNLLLRKMLNGDTKPANKTTLKDVEAEAPHVPSEDPA